MNKQFLSALSTLVFVGMVFPTGKVFAQESILSNEEIITIARTATLGVHFDRSRDISIVRTNGTAIVSFPRKPFRRSDPTNGIDHAAIVWVDETSGTLLSNPNLVPLSDERALFVATNAIPIPFDCSKTVRVDRASSLTLVTLPDHDYETAPGRVYRDAFLAKIWIDTETETVVDGVMGAN